MNAKMSNTLRICPLCAKVLSPSERTRRVAPESRKNKIKNRKPSKQSPAVCFECYCDAITNKNKWAKTRHAKNNLNDWKPRNKRGSK